MMAKLFFLTIGLAAFYTLINNVGDKQAAIALTACAGVFLVLTIALLKDA
jgi:hypothetical protein